MPPHLASLGATSTTPNVQSPLHGFLAPQTLAHDRGRHHSSSTVDVSMWIVSNSCIASRTRFPSQQPGAKSLLEHSFCPFRIWAGLCISVGVKEQPPPPVPQHEVSSKRWYAKDSKPCNRKISKTPGTRLPAQLALVLECPTWQCWHGLLAGDKSSFASMQSSLKTEHRPNSGQCMTKHGQNTQTDALPHATPVESKPPSFLCSRACHAET